MKEERRYTWPEEASEDFWSEISLNLSLEELLKINKARKEWKQEWASEPGPWKTNKQTWFVEFSNFPGVYTPSMANFKLSTWCHMNTELERDAHNWLS